MNKPAIEEVDGTTLEGLTALIQHQQEAIEIVHDFADYGLDTAEWRYHARLSRELLELHERRALLARAQTVGDPG